jgi:guanine deaminase
MPTQSSSRGQTVTAIRGAALSYLKDPFRHPIEECFVYDSDALVVMEAGIITGFGAAHDLL